MMNLSMRRYVLSPEIESAWQATSNDVACHV
jgi:hypothetical protein